MFVPSTDGGMSYVSSEGGVSNDGDGGAGDCWMSTGSDGGD